MVVYKITEMAPILGEVGHKANTPFVGGAWMLVVLRRVYAPSIINITATQSPQAGWVVVGTQTVGLWQSERVGAGWCAGHSTRRIRAIRASNHSPVEIKIVCNCFNASPLYCNPANSYYWCVHFTLFYIIGKNSDYVEATRANNRR